MNEIIYGLCVATSLMCAVMLLRAFKRSGYRLLFWSGICFALFAISNVVVVFDVYVTDYNLFFYRTIIAFAGVVVLLYGLIWETTS